MVSEGPFLCKKRLALGGDDLLYLLLKGYKEQITEKPLLGRNLC